MRTLFAMRLVAVSVVKNEADVIEAFVRHTRAWVDHHLVFDHDSTDGTREILRQLQAEGLPLSLFCDDAPGHLQQARSNRLTLIAAREHAADWILPLDADEFLEGPGRPQLEAALHDAGTDQAASLPLLDYCATEADDRAETNPVLRLRHCRPTPSTTRKIFLPRNLALDPTLQAGKGSHALYRGAEALPSRPLPGDWLLGHLALRSPQQQVLRIVRAELQRISRGQAAAGLDVHYRLGYQLLAEDPVRFLASLVAPTAGLRDHPIRYRGGPLRHTAQEDWGRIARAILPYLEQLATSHGKLADQTGVDVAPPTPPDLAIQELAVADADSIATDRSLRGFNGFTARSGWGRAEGPVPEAFLPRFHWAYAPSAEFHVDAPVTGRGNFSAEILTYCERQAVALELNGESLLEFEFPRVNQREHISSPLPLRVGRNELRLKFRHGLVTAHDPRSLAAIFLSLNVTLPTAP